MTVTHHAQRISVAALVLGTVAGSVRVAGEPGGVPWPPHQQVRLLDSLENGWPIGTLLAYNPTGVAGHTWWLLDGHRRLDALTRTPADGGLLRDLSRQQPTYLPAAAAVPDGVYLPVAAMTLTMPFLHATASLPQPLRRRAEDVAHQVMAAPLDVLVLGGGTPAQVVDACDRLLPGRVTAETIAAITG